MVTLSEYSAMTDEFKRQILSLDPPPCDKASCDSCLLHCEFTRTIRLNSGSGYTIASRCLWSICCDDVDKRQL